MTERKILFHGEIQLMRWSESSTNGATATFWVAPEDLESFKVMKARAGKTAGQRIACVMMEIGDDEAVGGLPLEAEEPPARAEPRAKPVGALGMLAVRWCKDPGFLSWVSNGWQSPVLLTEPQAKQLMLSECGVLAKYGTLASRKHFDVDAHCAERFHELFRVPYLAHLKATSRQDD